MDFTLRKYKEILECALANGYPTHPIADWWDCHEKSGTSVLLRHDVDRRPQNALALAMLENGLGVTSTYYFRTLPCSFVPSIIKEIHDLGHEIGYHYEDWSLAKFDKMAAVSLFKENLTKLREIAPVRSIAMHG